MLLVNIDHIPGRELEALGIVKGTVVQSKNFGKDFMAGMKTLVGGEISGYTEMLIEARHAGGRRGHRLRHGGKIPVKKYGAYARAACAYALCIRTGGVQEETP